MTAELSKKTMPLGAIYPIVDFPRKPQISVHQDEIVTFVETSWKSLPNHDIVYHLHRVRENIISAEKSNVETGALKSLLSTLELEAKERNIHNVDSFIVGLQWTLGLNAEKQEPKKVSSYGSVLEPGQSVSVAKNENVHQLGLDI